MSQLLDQIRDAISNSGLSQYRIAKDTGIDLSQLGRLMRGESGLGWQALDDLVEYLGLEIVVRPKRKRRPR